MSFQVKLYETNNVIEFVYKQEAGSIAPNGGGAAIGLQQLLQAIIVFFQLVMPNPSVSSTVETRTIGVKPATGQIYRWIPFCTALLQIQQEKKFQILPITQLIPLPVRQQDMKTFQVINHYLSASNFIITFFSNYFFFCTNR